MALHTYADDTIAIKDSMDVIKRAARSAGYPALAEASYVEETGVLYPTAKQRATFRTRMLTFAALGAKLVNCYAVD